LSTRFFFFYQHVIANEKKRAAYAAKLEKKALSNEQRERGVAAFKKYVVKLTSAGTRAGVQCRT